MPVSEVIGVKEGRVEIQPQKKVEDTDLDFTCKFLKVNSCIEIKNSDVNDVNLFLSFSNHVSILCEAQQQRKWH